MKSYRMNMTRPEFLLKFLTRSGSAADVTEEDLKRVIPGQSRLIYVAYTAIMESDIDKSRILNVNCDSETVGLQMESKGLAKQIKAECHKEMIRYGGSVYKIRVKVDGSYVFVSAEFDHKITDEEDMELDDK